MKINENQSPWGAQEALWGAPGSQKEPRSALYQSSSQKLSFWDISGPREPRAAPEHDRGGLGMLGRRTCRAKWAPAVRTGAAGERPSQQIRRRFNKFGADSIHIESDSIFGRRFNKY